MRHLLLIAVATAALSFFLPVPLRAQSSGSLPATPEVGANLPAQPVGPADLLAVTVYGAPEFSRTLRVSQDGQIRLPMLHQSITVQGMMPQQVEALIAEALSNSEVLVDPDVTVTIAEYHSRPISVAGAVKSPLTFQAVGKTTLLEALTRAQGLSDDAGMEILVTRPSRDGKSPKMERIPVAGLIQRAESQWNVTLEGGEEIRVPAAGKVFVVGNVKMPGAFRAEDGAGLSVLKALALAEGLAPFAQNEAYIYRRGDGPPKEIRVELRKIMDRKSPDVPLTANDVFYIPDNRSRRVASNAMERALSFAVGTASGALILGVNR